MKSSMLSAIERGRPAAVDYLNGEVVSRGAGHHIATPAHSGACTVSAETVATPDRAEGNGAATAPRIACVADAPDAAVRELEDGAMQPSTAHGARSRTGRDLCPKDPHKTLLPPNQPSLRKSSRVPNRAEEGCNRVVTPELITSVT